MAVKKFPKVDSCPKREATKSPSCNYNFVFSDDIEDWTNQKRVRATRIRKAKIINPVAQAKKKAYHRSMPSIGSQL